MNASKYEHAYDEFKQVIIRHNIRSIDMFGPNEDLWQSVIYMGHLYNGISTEIAIGLAYVNPNRQAPWGICAHGIISNGRRYECASRWCLFRVCLCKTASTCSCQFRYCTNCAKYCHDDQRERCLQQVPHTIDVV